MGDSDRTWPSACRRPSPPVKAPHCSDSSYYCSGPGMDTYLYSAAGRSCRQRLGNSKTVHISSRYDRRSYHPDRYTGMPLAYLVLLHTRTAHLKPGPPLWPPPCASLLPITFTKHLEGRYPPLTSPLTSLTPGRLYVGERQARASPWVPAAAALPGPS